MWIQSQNTSKSTIRIVTTKEADSDEKHSASTAERRRSFWLIVLILGIESPLVEFIFRNDVVRNAICSCGECTQTKTRHLQTNAKMKRIEIGNKRNFFRTFSALFRRSLAISSRLFPVPSPPHNLLLLVVWTCDNKKHTLSDRKQWKTIDGR